MSCCCQGNLSKDERSGPETEQLAASEPSSGGKEWAVLGLLILLAGLAMNLNLAVNLDEPKGQARWLLHGALAATGIFAILL